MVRATPLNLTVFFASCMILTRVANSDRAHLVRGTYGVGTPVHRVRLQARQL